MIYCLSDVSDLNVATTFCKLLLNGDILLARISDDNADEIINLLCNKTLHIDCTAILVLSQPISISSASTIIIEEGQIISTSSPYFCQSSISNCINFCLSNSGTIVCIHDDDIMHTSLWNIYKHYNPRYIFYISESATSASYLSMCKALAITCDQQILAYFSDQCIEITNNGTISDIQSGRLQLFSSFRRNTQIEI